jgi:hypothetical protein
VVTKVPEERITSTLKMEIILSFEALVTTYITTWRHNLEDHIPHFYYIPLSQPFSSTSYKVTTAVDMPLLKNLQSKYSSKTTIWENGTETGI